MEAVCFCTPVRCVSPLNNPHQKNRAPIRRRTTIVHKQAHEGVPISEDMYKKSVDMTKGIYRVTIKDAEGSKEGEEMGKRTEGK